MANTAIARSQALARVKNLLLQIVAPEISQVWMHEPQAIYGDRMAAVIYQGDAEPDGYGRLTMGHQLIALRFVVHVYWRYGGMDPGTLDQFTQEMIDLDREIQEKLSADRDLDGNATCLMVGPSEAGVVTRSYAPQNDAEVLLLLMIPFTIQELEAEAVAL